MAGPQGSNADAFLLALLEKYDHLSTDDILEAVETQTDIPTETARRALSNLADRGFIDVIEQGRGRRPTLYGIPTQLSPDAYDEAPLDGFPDEEDDSGYTPDPMNSVDWPE